MEFELSSGLHRDAAKRVDATFSFPVLLIIGSKSGTPFLSESAKTCQHYFSDFLTRAQRTRCRRSSARESRELTRIGKRKGWDFTEGTGSNKKKLWPPPQTIRLSPSAVRKFKLFFV
jgi:hypothetical protein